jgi:hypothetical protein
MPPSNAPRARQDSNVAQFDVDPCGDGYVVVDTTTGHPMTSTPRSHAKARQDAGTLNQAIIHGRRALAVALGAVEEDDELSGLGLAL